MSEERKKKAVEKKVIRENYLDFIEDLHSKGLPISLEQEEQLKDAGRIDVIDKPKKSRKRRAVQTDDSVKTEKQIESDKLIDIIEDDGEGMHRDFEILDNETYDKLQESDLFKYRGGKDVKTSDWMPDSVIEHDEKFIRWIDSINNGFQNMRSYVPFQMYCQQASDWLAENGDITDYSNDGDARAYAYEEIRRCRENTLYFMDKYLMLKEGDMSSGSMKYIAKPVHKVIAFMFDCGYSSMTGKPRQIAATSTYGACALKKITTNRNFFLKFITMDKESGIEIFDDKIKYPFTELPRWFRPTVDNDRDNLFRLRKKGIKKGVKKGMNSSIRVVAPSVAAINGGSPQLVMIDEAGYIGILGKMMKEARPTMFWQNPETNKIEMKRQIIIWGTGGEMDKGGKAYEEEYFRALTAWKNRDFTYGIIPIFFDWTTRPGITKEHYESERRAYTIEGPEKESRRVQFRQHYPSIVEDMFLTSSKLLVGIDWINQNIEKIYNVEHRLRSKKGYFEPIFDTSKPSDENSDVPYAITGATFVAVDDGDPRASVTMFMEPQKNWMHRYYMGTDPIMSDNGFSNMASAIFDAHYKTVSAFVDYRDSDHKYTFLQCMLLGIYYSAESSKSAKELVEANIGTAYTDYKEAKGFEDSLVWGTELPQAFHGGQNTYGIDNRGNRTRFIVSKMHEFFTVYGDRVYMTTPFVQLRTFVCTITKSGNESWGTVDPQKYHDDVLFAIVFAYICSLSYEHLTPFEIKSEMERYKTQQKLVRGKDGKLTRVEVRVPIY